MTPDAITATLLAEDSLLASLDPTAGDAEARCMAERLLADFDPEEVRELGLPDTLDEHAVLDDRSQMRAFFGLAAASVGGRVER